MAATTAERMPAVTAAPSTSDVTRRMVCGGLAGMIAKVCVVRGLTDTFNTTRRQPKEARECMPRGFDSSRLESKLEARGLLLTLFLCLFYPTWFDMSDPALCVLAFLLFF